MKKKVVQVYIGKKDKLKMRNIDLWFSEEGLLVLRYISNRGLKKLLKRLADKYKIISFKREK